MLSMFETPLSDLELSIQDVAARFARETLRPVGMALDKLPAIEAFKPDSAYWNVFRQFNALGLNLVEVGEGLTAVERTRLKCIVLEELGWGDAGLTLSSFANQFPGSFAALSSSEAIKARFTYDGIGCWGITEPDHGSDMLDYSDTTRDPVHGYRKSNCRATIRGDEIVINGQKSAWVGNGYVADAMVLFCSVDDGDERPGGAAFLVPLDVPGVSKGKPTDTIGLRSLPQGEVFFDGVRLSRDHMIIPRERYRDALRDVLLEANPTVGLVMNGMARAAYEHALNYCRERRQGGRPLVDYTHVRLRLFNMYRKLQASRALVASVLMQNAHDNPHIRNSVSAKVTGTHTAFEIAEEAMQLMGGAGVASEYPVEKMLRDAKTTMVADGTSDYLGLLAWHDL